MNLVETVSSLSKEAISLHDAHYKKNTFGLIRHDQAPNQNIIYHLYADGEITSQKGSTAYGNRGEFTEISRVFWGSTPFRFPLGNRETSWIILTLDEAKLIRKKMEDVLLLMSR
jgi:hypothetical protein